MRRAAICGLALGLLALPVLAAIPFAEERQIALWILRRGGQVMVDGGVNPLESFDLPDRDFHIKSWWTPHGTVIEPKWPREV
jgi:hypothetical protein